MEMQELLKKVEELKIVPVVVLEDAKDAIPLGQALIDGGLPVAEVTFRTAAAAAVRNVTSATGSPPSINACPRGIASFASSRTTTGTIFSSSTFFNNSCISIIYYLFSTTYNITTFHLRKFCSLGSTFANARSRQSHRTTSHYVHPSPSAWIH